MVDVGDRPKYDLVEQVRAANLGAARKRLSSRLPALDPVGAAVSPGSLISVSGANLEGAGLTMGDYDLPILYSSQSRIYAQVPWELAGGSSAQLVVSNGNSIDVALAAYSPGIFIAYPARISRGGSVTVYCTGLGPVSNQPATGEAAPLSPLAETLAAPTVMIGGAKATVTSSALAPGLLGVYQVVARAPDEAPSGSSVPLWIETGGARSNTVSVAID
jgi:uncharacterized protein (TIGR03437 family)